MSQTHSLAHSLTGRLAVSTIYPLFGDQFRRSLRFCHLIFDKEVISGGCRSEYVRYRWGFWILIAIRVDILWSLLTLFLHNMQLAKNFLGGLQPIIFQGRWPTDTAENLWWISNTSQIYFFLQARTIFALFC